jgi:hypothetical protein
MCVCIIILILFRHLGHDFLHVIFHDQFVMWYQNCYMMCAGIFLRGGQSFRMGFCGAVNIGHDEDLELWL